MTTSNQPPNLANELSKLKHRLDILERRLNKPTGQFKPEIVFSQDGAVTASGSPAYEFGVAERAYVLVARLVTPGSTDTTVDLLKNGTSVATVTVQADQYRGSEPISTSWAPDSDEFRYEVTSAGSGAQQLTVITRFKQI